MLLPTVDSILALAQITVMTVSANKGKDNQSQSLIGVIGCVFGALMMFNGITTDAKSSIHQIYSTLNWGFGVQTVLIGGYVIAKSKKEES